MDIGPLRITTSESGPLRISWISTDVHSKIPSLAEAYSDPLEFAAQILSRTIKEPKVSAAEVLDWGPVAIERIIAAWSRHPFALATELDKEDLVGSFRKRVLEHHERVAKRWKEMEDSLRTSPTFRAMQEALRVHNQLRSLYGTSEVARLIEQQKRGAEALQPSIREITSLQRVVQEQAKAIAATTRGFQSTINDALAAMEQKRRYVSSIFQNLPDPADLLRQSEGIRRGIDVLDDSGYGFTSHVWDYPFVVELGQLKPGIRGAVATNRFAAFCRDPEFQEELKSLLEATPVFRRRWSLVRDSLSAYNRREYSLAIPLLLAQMEGCITDMLVLRGEASLYRGKLYARGKDGKAKKDRNGKPIRLIGLDSKLTNSRWQGEAVLESVAEIVADHLIAERNNILHGRNLSYAKAKLATQCILIIWILGQEVKDKLL